MIWEPVRIATCRQSPLGVSLPSPVGFSSWSVGFGPACPPASEAADESRVEVFERRRRRPTGLLVDARPALQIKARAEAIVTGRAITERFASQSQATSDLATQNVAVLFV